MSQCPKCGFKCYESFTGVECTNNQCSNYHPDAYTPPPKAEVTQTEAVEQDDPDKVMWYWSHYHTDCGD